MHLREADSLRDLSLRQPLREAHAQDLALARGQAVERRFEGGAVLRALEPRVLSPDRLERIELLVTAGAARERDRGIRRAHFHGLEHLLRRGLQLLGDLRDTRRAAEASGEALDGARHRRVQLLERARHADCPALVAEVALDLADHVRGRVGGERHLALELEAVDRLDQADRAHLLDVLERLAAPRVAPRERAHQREVALDQLLAGGRVAVLAVAAQQGAVLLTRLLRRHRRTALGSAHGRPLSFSSRTTMAPSPTSSTPNESTTVCRIRRSVSWPGGLSPSRSASATADSDSGPTRVRILDWPTSNDSRTLPTWPASASRRSTASWRSSISSKAKSTRSAMPPMIRRTTAWKSPARGASRSMRSCWLINVALRWFPRLRH